MTEDVGSEHPPLKVVSVDLELSALEYATRGAQMIADLQTRNGLMDEEMEQDAPSCIMSILALVTGRIGQVRRIIRGEENPAHIWAPHNSVEDPATHGEFDGDMVLFPWDSFRLPLIMWNPTAMGAEVPRERRGREVAPEASGPQEDKPGEPSASGPFGPEPIPAHGQEAKPTDGAGEGAPSVSPPEAPEGKRKRGPARQHGSRSKAPRKAAQ